MTGARIRVLEYVRLRSQPFGDYMVKSRFRDVAALAVLALLCLGVYAPHILGRTTTIGTIDRLATFMSVRKFHVETIRKGELQGWNERTLMGVSTWGLPHIEVASLFWTRKRAAISGCEPLGFFGPHAALVFGA
jgi:hypothetical protein